MDEARRRLIVPTRLRRLLVIGIALAAVAGAIRFWAPSRPAPRGGAGGSGLWALGSGGTARVDEQTRMVVALSQHLAREPGDTKARFQLAELYFKLKDYPRSLQELRELERRTPRDANVLLRQAVVLKQTGELERAEAAARRALAVQPGFGLAEEWLGEIYLEQARYHQALALFERCLKQRPDAYFALLGKSRALEQQLLSRHPIPPATVIAPVERAVKLKPENPEGLATLARLLFTYREQADEGERLALRAAALDRDNPRPYIILAQIALSRPATPENLAKAGDYAYQAGARDLRDPRPPYFIGRIALQQNEVERAVKALERSLELGPTPEAVSQLAIAYRRAGNVGAAEKHAAIFQRYTDLLERRNTLLALRERHPDDVTHVYDLVNLYLDAEQPETAAQWLDEAKRVRPNDARYAAALGRVRGLREMGGDGPMLPVP